MKEELYISLLYKKLSGELSPSESTELNDWLEASEDHRLQAAAIEKSWNLSGQYQRPDVEINLDEHFAELSAKMKEEEESSIPHKTPVRQLPPRRNWLGVAAALAILVTTGFLLRNYFMDTVQMQQFTLAEGETKELVLGDGTKIWVNERSTISYPGVFDKKERRINLQGEAYFEVAENPAQPFIIQTPTGTVKVLGTSFNVRDYTGETDMEVDVSSGKVQLQANGQEEKLILILNEKGVVNKDNKKLHKETETYGNASFWHKQKLTYKERPLKVVIAELEKYYQVNIQLNSATMQDCPFTASFERKKLSTILETITGVFSLKMEVKDKQNYLLSGGICP